VHPVAGVQELTLRMGDAEGAARLAEQRGRHERMEPPLTRTEDVQGHALDR
jgi:hypothetical protein